MIALPLLSLTDIVSVCVSWLIGVTHKNVLIVEHGYHPLIFNCSCHGIYPFQIIIPFEPVIHCEFKTTGFPSIR